MLRAAIARVQVPTGAMASTVRYLSASAVLQAPPAGKKKVKMGFKAKAETTTKAKKGGMTHLKFRDAVRLLNFENLAADYALPELTKDLKPSTVVRYNSGTEERLKTLGSFKKFQHHELAKSPASLVSANTIAVHEQFVKNLDKPSKDNKVFLLGEKGVGKSTLISQAKALAVAEKEDVILLHLDQPEKLVNGTSDYIFNTTLGKYQQPMFTKRFVKTFRAANQNVLTKLPLSRDITFTAKKVEHKLKKGENTLYDLVLLNHDFGLVGPSTAFQFLIEELVHASKTVPVLVSVDDFNALVTAPFTKYRNPDFTPVHLSEFEFADFVLKVVSGDLTFAKGGVLLAESKDHFVNETIPVGLGMRQDDAYYESAERDFLVANALLKNGGFKTLDVKNLTKDETRALMQFWEQSGALKLRDYPTKEEFQSYENLVQEQHSRNTGLYVESEDSAQLFENSVQSTFTVSSGNPGYLLKATHMAY